MVAYIWYGRFTWSFTSWLNGMNRVLVSPAAGGLAEYLSYDKEPSIVIGYDGRKNSDVFCP